MANMLNRLLNPTPMQSQSGAMPVMQAPQMQAPQMQQKPNGMNFMRDLLAGALLSYGGVGVGPVIAGQQNRRRQQEEMQQQAQAQQQTNATKAWLKSQGREDLLPLVDAGQAGQAIQLATQREQGPDLPAVAQEYEYARQNGFQGSFMDYQAGKQRQGAGVTYNNPQWLQDPQSKQWVYGVTGSDGSFKVVPTPDGLEFAGPEGVARARSYGTETGQIQGAAQGALPQAAGDLEIFNQAADSIINDPYLPSMVGPIDSLKPNISGDAARFNSKVDQLKGQVFLSARAKLKGGGAITDMEGQKAEQALLRASMAQNEKDFIAAIEESKMYLARGFAILQQQAAGQGGAVPQAAPAPGMNPGNTKRLRYNPATGNLE